MHPSLSVVIPAFNEESRLPANLQVIAEYLRQRIEPPAEILVVNDGSTDRTAELAEEKARVLGSGALRIAVLNNPGNRGKGYSVRHGVLEARSPWILVTDADLSAPIEECDKLFAAVAAQACDGAIGSRGLDRSLIGVHQPVFREVMGRAFNLAVQAAAGLPFRDTQCGFKLFSRKAAQQIFARQRLEGFGFDVEILYLARKLGFEIAEVPVRWDHCEGSTVRMLAGADAFVDILRVRCNDWTGKYDRA